jgi:putative transposase
MLGKTEYWPQFFTATILEWKPLLENNKYKDLIIDSLKFLYQNKRAVTYGFCIMSNHIHLIWHVAEGHKREDVQRDFLKYTAQRIKADLEKSNPAFLKEFKVDAKDRAYQIWERNPLSIDIYTEKVMVQKLTYIHENPVKSRKCRWPEEYPYSSAYFYYTAKDRWGFLRHYLD